jgi:hypothetical protein
MKLLKQLIHNANAVAAKAYSAFSSRRLTRPVFIVGCGRSGTTILGNTLARHRRVTYLNEPRHLWCSCYPETDVWSAKAAARKGRVVLTEADADPGKSNALHRLFLFETVKTGRPVFIEKLPINTFRLPFIVEMFPDARFVHIYRNGREVAKSIAREDAKGRWFVATAYRWKQLVQLASAKEDTSQLVGLCTDPYEKGLLEWRLSTEAAVGFFRGIPADSYYELSYANLVDNPLGVMQRLLSFLDIEVDRRVVEYARDRIIRKTKQPPDPALSPIEKEIGGELLPLTMDAQIDGGLSRQANIVSRSDRDSAVVKLGQDNPLSAVVAAAELPGEVDLQPPVDCVCPSSPSSV